MKKKKILIVDDQERNIKILSVYCKNLGHQVLEARNGREALEVTGKEFPDAHIKRISYYTRELSAALGMPSEFTDTIYNASSMHDIGKVSIPDAVLLKKDRWITMSGLS